MNYIHFQKRFVKKIIIIYILILYLKQIICVIIIFKYYLYLIISYLPNTWFG